MWLIPFIAGAGVTWLFSQGLSNQVQGAEKRFLDHIESAQSRLMDEMRSEIRAAQQGVGPAVTEHMSSAAKTKFEQIKESFLPYVSDLIQRWRADKFGAATFDVRAILSSFPGIIEAVSMYYAMVDKNTSWRTRLEIAAGLAYLVAPNDWLPDSELDDMAVVLYVWNKVREQRLYKVVQEITHGAGFGSA